MPNSIARTLATAALALAFLGATACSDDDGSGDADRSAAQSDGASGGASDLDDSSDRPFGVDADGIAEAMKAGTAADSVEVDGNTIRLHFDEGSKDDPTSTVKCSAMDSIKGDDDVVVMVYPDGELSCEDALAARGG